ncbi:MAG: ACT domain-containing protein [Syntrophomonas sp.]
MSEQGKKFYRVREDILPEAILKTALAKEMIARKEACGIQDAVEQLGIARSTFYKYRDGIFSFFDSENMKILNISLLLKHLPGVLSGVLNCIASFQANILTINQNLPVHGVAPVTVSLSIEEMTVSADELVISLKKQNGVLDVEIVGKS